MFISIFDIFKNHRNRTLIKLLPRFIFLDYFFFTCVKENFWRREEKSLNLINFSVPEFFKF